jgi:hypothetical protein
MTSDMERFEAEQERAAHDNSTEWGRLMKGNTDSPEYWRDKAEGLACDLDSAIEVMAKRVWGGADMASMGTWLSLNYGKHKAVTEARKPLAEATRTPHHTPEAGILSEEIIAKAAVIIDPMGFTSHCPQGCEQCAASREMAIETARACLTAALPGIVEALKPFVDCADSFDDYPIKDATRWGIWSTTSNDPSTPSKQITVADLRRIREIARSLTHSSKGE